MANYPVMYANTVTIGSKVWNVNIVSSQADLAQGFSNVASTPPQTGILFNLGGAHTNITVDMQSMLFPLDIAFIDGNGKVVDIVHNLPPLQDHICLVSCNYFLEVNTTELNSVNVGDTVIMTGISSTAILSGINISSIIEMMLVMMIMKMMMKAV
jgi:uncharacterized membrane protein (UPF0127 family)